MVDGPGSGAVVDGPAPGAVVDGPGPGAVDGRGGWPSAVEDGSARRTDPDLEDVPTSDGSEVDPSLRAEQILAAAEADARQEPGREASAPTLDVGPFPALSTPASRRVPRPEKDPLTRT